MTKLGEFEEDVSLSIGLHATPAVLLACHAMQRCAMQRCAMVSPCLPMPCRASPCHIMLHGLSLQSACIWM